MRSWRNKSQRGFKLTLPKIILLILILILALIFLIIKFNFLNVKILEISITKANCTDEKQISSFSNILGRNFFLTNQKSIEQILKGKFICIRNVTLNKTFPDKIKLQVWGRDAFAIVIPLKNKEATAAAFLENIATPSANPSDEDFLVDREGVIFAKAVNIYNQPKIFVNDSSLSLGKLNNNFAQNCLKILEKTQQFGLDINTSLVWDNVFIIFSSPKIYFKLDNSIESQIASLQLILEKAKIDQRSVEFVDLRFDKPIIRFAPKQHG